MQGTAQQHVRRQRILCRCIRTGNHAVIRPVEHFGQHPQPHLLVFPRGGFHPPQRELPRRQKQRLPAERGQVVDHLHGLRLVRNQHYRPAGQRTAQRMDKQHLMDMAETGQRHRRTFGADIRTKLLKSGQGTHAPFK